MKYFYVIVVLIASACHSIEPVPETYRGIPLASCDVPEPKRRPNTGTCLYENDYARAVVRHTMDRGWRIISFERKKLSDAQREKYNNPPDILAPTRMINGQNAKPIDLADIIKPKENIRHDKKSKKYVEEDPY